MDNIGDFELLLQKQSVKKPSILYNKDLNPSEQTHKPQDVIKTVYSQVKALQFADCVRSGKSGCKDLNEANKSEFLPLNKLPVYGCRMQEVSKANPHKFETQCVLDTQLMNIIDGEAVINANTGMTQEFDTTFTHADDINNGTSKLGEEKSNFDVKNKSISVLDDFNIVTKCRKSSEDTDIIGRQKETEKQSDDNIAIQNLDNTIDVNIEQNSQMYQTATEDTVTFTEHFPFTQEVNEELDEIMNNSKEIDIDKTSCSTENKIDTGQDTERSPSPVLNMIPIKRKTIRTLSPLVVPLETFQNFENLAISLIDETDFETAKHLINSQILDKELCLNDDTDVLLRYERDTSPVLDFKRNELHINSNEVMPTKSNEAILLQDVDVIDKSSEVLKDEILFSSDEEDFAHIESQNLPLTCALETSSDQTDILEKSMYVGFQTASNKSIQISKNSFEHAQSILSGESKAVEEFSLNELVEKCDSLKSKHLNDEAKDANLVSVSKEFTNRLKNKQENKDSKHHSEKIETYVNIRDTNVVSSKQRTFNGFMTASKKKINMSIRALERCQKVFKDIDLHENYNDVIVSAKTDPAIERKSCISAKIYDSVNVEENIDDKLNDVILLKEFENFEMSLKEKESDSENGKHLACESSQTDNSKKITISQEAMVKTNNIPQNIGIDLKKQMSKFYKDVNLINAINQPSISEPMFVGFKTANNKEIKVTEEALAKSKDVFNDIGKDKRKIKTIEDVSSQLSTSNTKFVGFKTANNKAIKISGKAMSKVKNIFKDIDKEQPKVNTSVGGNRPSTNKGIFEVASAANCKVPEKALSKSINVAEKMLVQCEIEEPEPEFKGFTTASDKQVKISEQVIEKNRKLFSEVIMKIMDDNDSINIVSKEIGESDKSTKINFVGFKTANNKSVNICEEALQKTKKIFANLDPIASNDETPFFTNIKKHENYMLKDYESASKKSAKVFSNALPKSSEKKIILLDVDDPSNLILAKNTNNEFKGVQTANKAPVEVSKEAVIVIEKLFKDSGHQVKNSGNTFVTFMTASNKNVNISDKALAKCKKIFEDIDDITAQSTKSELKDDIFKGFQTANEKVDVSKQATEMTKIVCDGVGDVKKDTGKSSIGFKTANNNQVIISEEALAKGRQLFQDKDTESDTCIPKNHNTIHPFGFETGYSKKITVSEVALTKSKKFFDENIEIHSEVEIKPESFKDIEIKTGVVRDKLLDTQIVNDFEEAVCTEDFRDTRPNKRSGSPILVCPKAKRKKFETPYKINPKSITESQKILEVTKPPNGLTFSDNYKKIKKYTLQDLAGLEKGKSTIDPYIFNFNLENILNFEFDEARNEFNKSKMTIDDIKQIFTEAIDKKLIPDGWLDIHLKLILWKLISYEIRLPNTLGKVCTARNVIDQLKYRYDKELYNAQRSVLRKILEKDDVPSKTMVLCVAGIYVDGISVVSAANPNNIELLLTDGWYLVKATIDNMLSKLVYDGKIVVGSKIVTCGAELMNCEQGVAPWEDTSSIRLSICGNSTRPAHWSEKLGLRPRVMLSRLAGVRVGGGKAARLRAAVVRVYPRLYVEKFEDGSTVTRSERLEHQYQMKYEAEREAMIEKICEEVEKEMSCQQSQNSDGVSEPSSKRKCFDSGSQIDKMMKTSKDPVEFQAQLTSSQIHLLQDHVSKQRDKYLQAIQDRVRERLQTRNVVTLARGRVAGLERDGDRVTITKGMLSIWKPNDEVLDIFKEGSWIEVTNVVPTAFRNSEIQLSAGRQSAFRPVKCKEEDIFKPYLIPLSRTCYNLKALSQNPSMTTDYNEIDTVGIIFEIDPPNRDFDSNKNQFQNVYLADIDKNMICVNFWGGIKKFGYENILDTGQVIYCGNLQKRAGNTRKNVPQFRATEFAIFTRTPKNEKGREMVDEMSKKMFGLDRRKFCEDCVVLKQNFSVIRCFNDSVKESPYRFNKSDFNLAKNKMFIETPVGVKVKNKAEDFNLTGLDFESTFKQQDTQLSPKTLDRKKKINAKIAKLKMYGEPPALSPIHFINYKNATNSYKSPLRKTEIETSNSKSVTSVDKLQGVATPTKLPDDSVTIDGSEMSPIISNISINRTYVKRTSVNPVKLNFSVNNEDRTVDHFAEEFDGSPPLSLE